MVTTILFCLLITVILFKPTCYLRREEDDKIAGYEGALIQALYYQFIVGDTIIISRRKFDYYWNMAEEQTNKNNLP